MIQIKPFGKNILVQPTVKSQVLVSDSGTLCEYGKVVAVGSEVIHVKEGDEVGFLVWGIQKLEVEDQTYYFIPENSDFLLGYIQHNELPTEQV